MYTMKKLDGNYDLLPLVLTAYYYTAHNGRRQYTPPHNPGESPTPTVTVENSQ